MYFILFLLPYIFFAHGQKVITKPSENVCVSSSVTLRCPVNYVVIVTSAIYGVTQRIGFCSYSVGDCFVDEKSLPTCQTDSTQCSVYATKKKLPQCNDQFASYLNIKYDCVPLSTNNPSEEYNVCQNGVEITSDYGILKSPGYPSQFQTTTTECIRTIHVPKDKAIRLWMSDLNIGGSDINCRQDHVYVIDVGQTYRYCGVQRFFHPYLCSSTIIIQYLATTQSSSYRGMRMYFEIVNRSANDSCPNLNGTMTSMQSITPSITIPVPTYVTFGIASPVQGFQLCKGQSYTLNCPANYSIAVRTNIYGVTQSNQCEPYDASKHCVSKTNSTSTCRQNCTYMYTDNQVLLLCNNKTATYQYMEYQCIPTTISVDQSIPIWAQNLERSPVLSTHICRGTSQTIQCPRGSDYVLSIIESIYGVTGTNVCDLPSASHCHQSVSLNLTCTNSCVIEYHFPKPVVTCGSQNADYISIVYECIPTRLPNNKNPIDVCESKTTDTIVMNSSIMISPQYPTLDGAHTCSRKLETLPNKLWLVFIIDLFLEGKNDIGNCDTSSLTIYDGNNRIILCDLRQTELILVSCSYILDFKFISTNQTVDYRGFKVYLETIDVPNNWMCKPTGFTTLLPPTTTSAPLSTTQIAAYGGTTNGTRRYCRFPFVYRGNLQTTCLKTDPSNSILGQINRQPWCSLTSNFDTDGQWGFCELGVTDFISLDVCQNESQILRCPFGYVINIITADYAAKTHRNISTNTCIYDKNDCFQNDIQVIQSTCAGKPSCIIYHYGRTLPVCGNQRSTYLHIDYNCIPNDITEISTYDFCNSNSLPKANETDRGFLISPNFPNTVNNIVCVFNLQTVKLNQVIDVYVIDMDLNMPNIPGQSCMKDKLIVNDDNNLSEWCGYSYTRLLLRTCSNSISLQLIRLSDAEGSGVKLYFESRERSSDEICSMSSTTSARPSTTIAPFRPSYFPDPSPHVIKTFCYPTISFLSDENTIQCPQDYVIVILQAFYGRGTRCDYTPGDCTDSLDMIYRTCAGRQTCSVSFTNTVMLSECNKTADYLFIDYQCLPTSPNVHTAEYLCLSHTSQTTKRSGILASSLYPMYIHTECNNVTLISQNTSNDIIYLYILDLSIGDVDLNTSICTNDYVLLTYQCNSRQYVQRLCGTRKSELLLKTCIPTDKITISYRFMTDQQDSLRGFTLVYHFVRTFDISSTTIDQTILTSAPTITRNVTAVKSTTSYLSVSTTSVSTSRSVSTNWNRTSTIYTVPTTKTSDLTSSWVSTTRSSTISVATTVVQSMGIIDYGVNHLLTFLSTIVVWIRFYDSHHIC